MGGAGVSARRARAREGRQGSRESGTHLTERSLSNGTISSTSVLGVLPSGVTPVAQHCRACERVSSRSKSSAFSNGTSGTHLLDIGAGRQLLLVEQAHALLGHREVERELQGERRVSLASGAEEGRELESQTHLLLDLAHLRQAREHVLHVVDARAAGREKCVSRGGRGRATAARARGRGRATHLVPP